MSLMALIEHFLDAHRCGAYLVLGRDVLDELCADTGYVESVGHFDVYGAHVLAHPAEFSVTWTEEVRRALSAVGNAAAYRRKPVDGILWADKERSNGMPFFVGPRNKLEIVVMGRPTNGGRK